MSSSRPVPRSAAMRAYVGGGGARRRDRHADEVYKVDDPRGNGRKHAWERHTREGICAVGRVLTSHEQAVSVFTSLATFEDAVGAMPTRGWYPVDSSRWDAETGGVHYQATLLGDTMALTSCYPVGGREYGRRLLERLLERGNTRDVEQFWRWVDEADDLDRRLVAIWKTPPSAVGAEIDDYERLRRVAGDAIDGGRLSAAESALEALGARAREIQAAAGQRAAAQAEKEKAVASQGQAARAEVAALLKLAPDAGTQARARAVLDLIQSANLVVSPGNLSDLKTRYGL